MKKILLATTLLAASAGYASAEVAVSGSARMGIVYDGTDAAFSSRVRIQFDGTGTTDGGLTFGATMRADQNGGNGAKTVTVTGAGVDGIFGTADDTTTTTTIGNTGTTNGDSTVFISGAFGTLTMGDVAGGAADNLVGQVSGIGFTGLTDQNEIGFMGGTATAARYNFSSGPFSVALGVGQASAADDARSIAVKYDGGTFTVALGYSEASTLSQIDAKASATFGPITAKLRLADREGAADVAAAVSVDYAIDALTITAFATQNRDFAGTDTAGVGAAYDLGGGAALKGGVADNGTDTIGEVGVTMSF